MASPELRPESAGPVVGAQNGDDIVIEARQLSKSFGDVQAVKDVSFKVRRGEVFGFFGPNGAGKTTTIRLLCALTRPTFGTAIVCGRDVMRTPNPVRKNLAIVQEEVSYYEKMTPAQYLSFFARMAGHSRRQAKAKIDEAVRVSEVSGFLDKRIGSLSHGQRQKISIARVLLSDAPVMFLDEPFQGIDIIHRKALREHLRAYVAKGNTVFFTSHNLVEAELIVDRFAFIDKGELLTIGTSRDLRDRYLQPAYAVRVSDVAKAQEVLRGGLPIGRCEAHGDEVELVLKDIRDVPKVAAVLGSAGISLLEMRQLGTMEEIFLRIRQERDGAQTRPGSETPSSGAKEGVGR